MYKIIFSLFLILVNISVFAQDNKDAILGKWANESSDRIIEFTQNNHQFFATIKKAKETSLVGKTQISNLKKTSTNTYDNGTIFLIQQGKTASCTAILKNQNELEIIGKMGWFTKSQKWKRVND